MGRPNNKVYDKFAAVYDRLGADRFSVQMVQYTRQIMRRYDIHPSTGLDLCCGTGSALKLFAEQGVRMSGLDQSAAMLRQARRKLRGTAVSLYHQELPHFDIRDRAGRRRRFDLVTCFYDSLNYLTSERKLVAAFRAVYRHLNEGGWFVFDMNTPRALKQIWDSYVWGGTTDDLAWIWTNTYEPKKRQGHCATTFFVRSGRHWARFDELHVEQGYSNRTIRNSLRQANLTVRGFYLCRTFDPPDRDTMRVCVVAQRRA